MSWKIYKSITTIIGYFSFVFTGMVLFDYFEDGRVEEVPKAIALAAMIGLLIGAQLLRRLIWGEESEPDNSDLENNT